jgi:uncharacterized protein
MAIQKISGYAAVFNKPSKPMAFRSINGGRPFREVISYGAFADSLASPDDLKLLINHDPTLVLASRNAGTLKAWEDAYGLAYEASLDDQQTYANDLLISIARGDITGMSFKLNIPKGGDRWSTDNGMAIRTLTLVGVDEITVTGFPAYPATTVDVGAWRGDMNWDKGILPAMKRLHAMDAQDNDNKLAELTARMKAVTDDYAKHLRR